MFDLTTPCDRGGLGAHQFLGTVNDAALQKDRLLQIEVSTLKRNGVDSRIDEYGRDLC